MPSNPDRPFDHDTLKLRAVFVPENAKDQLSKATITGALGYDAVKIPAVFVPEGGTPPGYPYERFGRAVFRPDADNSEKRSFTTEPSSSQSPDAAQQNGAPAPRLPRTRYRFGAALSGGGQPGSPPNPALAGRQGERIAAGIAVWRGMANPGKTLRQGLAVPGPAPDKHRGLVTGSCPPSHLLKRT
ncbi:MAG: hypothetical protein ABSC95_20235 [Acetobacteraceae bacterium]|jgi:hypothetical protein